MIINSTPKKIDTLESIQIGNVQQYIAVRSNSPELPLILFLHGGPGTAQILFTRKIQHDLENHFIVVNWDQRGAGKSYNRHIQKSSMTIDQFLSDAEEVIPFLLKKFNQKKLFLVGHSWGSLLGIRLANRIPDLIHAYIAIGQIVDMKEGELLSYQYVLNKAKETNNAQALKELERIGEPPYKSIKDAGIQRKWLNKFHGATYSGNALFTLFKNISLKDYRLGDILKFIKGVMFSLNCLEDTLNLADLREEIEKVKVPVYFCCGKQDYNVPSALVASEYEKLNTDRKGLKWFEKSAHLPNFEQPKEFCEYCIEIKNNL